MECKNRKDADAATPTSQGNISYQSDNYASDYSKVKKFCLFIHIISVIGFLIAYHKTSVEWMYFSAGALLTTAIMHVYLYPIEEDEK